ncbi:hypothetical protein [Streptomyces albiflavescens]|uniref:hypothetical protein n=1 Tax=Streptomyces albiflavescens TaxID=1623582 RepID=UPI00166AB3B6|nr:hypothetical protein [Streptomyces albiflavescens]
MPEALSSLLDTLREISAAGVGLQVLGATGILADGSNAIVPSPRQTRRPLPSNRAGRSHQRMAENGT